MLVSKLMTPVPLVSGLALQFGESTDWTRLVGLFAIAAITIIIGLDRIGLLRKIGGNGAESAQLAESLDALGKKVAQLDATIVSQVRIMGSFTEEIRAATRQASATHNFITLQTELERERRLRRDQG